VTNLETLSGPAQTFERLHEGMDQRPNVADFRPTNDRP
jgi:hypothetical protein